MTWWEGYAYLKVWEWECRLSSNFRLPCDVTSVARWQMVGNMGTRSGVSGSGSMAAVAAPTVPPPSDTVNITPELQSCGSRAAGFCETKGYIQNREDTPLCQTWNTASDGVYLRAGISPLSDIWFLSSLPARWSRNKSVMASTIFLHSGR